MSDNYRVEKYEAILPTTGVLGPVKPFPPYIPVSYKPLTGKNVNAIQYGGTHYKDVKYQPWDVILDWKLGFLDGTALKYISRWRKKNGIEDLQKAIHFLEKLVEEETKNDVK